MDVLDRIVDCNDCNDLACWMQVPVRVGSLVKEARPVAATVRRVTKHLPASSGYGYVFWHPEDKTLHAVLGDGDDAHSNKWANALKAITGVRNVTVSAETHPRDEDDWVLIKKAAPLGLLSKPIDWAGKMTGGPSPLSNALVGGLMTGGLGYGTGWLLEHLFPERFVERGRLRKTLGLLGAGVGAVPGAWQGYANYQNAQEAGQPMGVLRTAVTPHEQVPINPRMTQKMETGAYTAGPHGATWDYDTARPVGDMEIRNMQARLGDLPDPPEMFVRAATDFLKCGAGVFEQSAGGAGLRPVPMDAFNRAIWNDVRKGMTASRNPFGTKSPWGYNDQPMHTPPELGAAATGLNTGIQSMFGNRSVLSPQHFIKGLATAGVDLVTSRLVGGALGALGGMTPEAQEKLQNMGVWGGLIRGTVGSMLGM